MRFFLFWPHSAVQRSMDKAEFDFRFRHDSKGCKDAVSDSDGHSFFLRLKDPYIFL